MNKDGRPQMDTSEVSGTGAEVDRSRRSLLRGASTALPAIFTLQSGAALAASSNLLGTVKHASKAVGEGGRVQCVDGASAVGGTPSVLDLGDDPMVHVQYITPRQYYRPNRRGTAGDPDKPVTIEQMCSGGGVYWYKENGNWKATTPGYNRRGIEAGFFASATALSSFASDIKVKTTF